MDRRWWLAGMGAALAGPYLALDGNMPFRDRLLGPTPTPTSPGSLWHDQRSQEGFDSPAVPLQEVLRADVTPDWVVSRWPRVTTMTGEIDWAGMRVPLITGNQPGDVVGSLTYFFDAQHRLRRLSLEGYTADEGPTVALACNTFGLRPEHSLGAGLYVYRWNREPLSVLAVQYAPVVDAEAPQTRRKIMLEINRPEAGWRLSPAMKTLVSPMGW